MKTNSEMIEKFLKSNTCSNLLESSKTQYRADLIKFFSLVDDKHYSELRMSDLEEYTDFYNSEDYSASSVNKHLASFRKFITYLTTFDHNENIDINKFKIAFKSVKDRSGKKGKGCIPMDLDEYIPFNNFVLGLRGDTVFTQRKKVAVLIMSTVGLRNIEMTNLLKSSINFNKLEVMPNKTKGDKQRVKPVALPKVVAEEIKKLYNLYEAAGIKGDYVLMSKDGEMFKETKQTSKLVKSISDMALRRGVVKRKVTPHVLRKSLAVYLRYVGKYDMQAIADILGHESINTTEIYTQLRVENEDNNEAVELF